MVFLTRRERFSSAHRMFRPDWDDAKNYSVFGQCANPNWHGHNYELFVTVKGEVNPETGFVINLKTLSTILKEKIVKKMDHKNINVEVDFMQGKIASSENIAIAIWNEIANDIALTGAQLHCVKIIETENNFIEYYG